MKQRYFKRRILKNLLVDKTLCSAQHTGWPCNTCFHAMKLGIDGDRLHTLWEATLLLRGDYNMNEYNLYRSPEQFESEINEIIELLLKDKGDPYTFVDGYFKVGSMLNS